MAHGALGDRNTVVGCMTTSRASSREETRERRDNINPISPDIRRIHISCISDYVREWTD